MYVIEDRLMASSYQHNNLPSKLEDTLFKAKYLIQIYALSQQIRPKTLINAFGKNIKVEEVQWLIKQLEEGDFSTLPEVGMKHRLSLGGLRSLYVPEQNTIYLAEDFIEGADKDELLAALLQEIVSAMRLFYR